LEVHREIGEGRVPWENDCAAKSIIRLHPDAKCSDADMFSQLATGAGAELSLALTLES